MIQPKRNIDLLTLYTGLFFISVTTLPFVFQSILFMANITASKWLFPTIVLGVFVVCKIKLYQSFNSKTVTMWSVFIALLLYTSYQLCINFYDFSYDGMWYQQDGVRLIAQGWNPFNHYLSLEETSLSDLYLNHYPKATWISSGTIYAFTNKLESGKIINWFALFASACFCYVALKSLFKLNTFTLILLSALLAFNPVVIYQIFTFYVDGLLGSLLTILVCVSILFHTQKISTRCAIFCACVLIAFTVNIKFTALIYVCVFAMGNTLFAFLHTSKSWLKQSIILLTIFIGGVLILGFPTYVRNTISHGHPFYPIMGKGNIGQEVAKVTMPANFLDKNRFEQFNLATFARAQWSRDPYNSRAKALFSSDSFTIWDEFKRADPEMSGFGPLFAEILLLVGMGIVWLIILKHKQISRYYILAVCTIVFSIIIIPAFWYARYVPQLWLLVWLLVIPLFEHSKLKFLGYLICVFALTSDIIIAQKNMLYRIKQTQALNKQFDMFKQSKTIPIIDDGWVESFKIKLAEEGIKYALPTQKYPTDSITIIPNVEMSSAFYVNSSVE